ncbi:MAG: protein translocase subunit SecF, partial [Lysobacterales bacterium]
MELVKTHTHIDFMGQRKLALLFSGLLLLVSVVSFGVRGLNYGIDFTGGTLIEVGFPETADLVQVRSDLATAGFSGATVQYFGTPHDLLVRLAPRADLSEAELSSSILRVLRISGGDNMQLRRVEYVGPQVGEELTEQGGLAMLIALGAILVYVSLRFLWKFSLGAVVALFHDVIITIGFFSVLGLEFDLTVLAAVLAV